MTHADISRAVERLQVEDCGLPRVDEDGSLLGLRLINAPLIALIEAAARPVRSGGGEWCHFCGTALHGQPWPHSPDCALADLVAAINGARA